MPNNSNRRVNNRPSPPASLEEPKEVRAREEDGTFKPDDPETPEVNEAFDPPRIQSKDVRASARPKVGSPVIHPKNVVKGPTFGNLGVHTVSN